MSKIKLSADNYYSTEANQQYMSVSQYKDFAGTYGIKGCEACAMAKMNGEYVEEPNTAMMIGSYIDAYFEGTLYEWIDKHPEVFTQASLKKGSPELRSEYKKANNIINRCERDSLFMKYLSGEKQVIMTGELFGAEWKVKLDSYITDKAIVDLKCMASITKVNWVKDIGYLDFVRYWGYDIQGAIYQKIVEINTGKHLPFYIAVCSKEDEPDIELIHVTDNFLTDALYMVETHIQRILHLKAKDIEPDRCEVCNYCKSTKVLRHPISILDLVADI